MGIKRGEPGRLKWCELNAIGIYDLLNPHIWDIPINSGKDRLRPKSKKILKILLIKTYRLLND